MQRGFAVRRIDEGHVVDASGEPWQEIGHPKAGLSMLAKLPVTRLAIAGLRGEELQRTVGIEWLPSATHEFRFTVKGVHMTDPARAEDLDDALCFRDKRRRTTGTRIAQHGRQCHTTEPASRFRKKIAAIQRGTFDSRTAAHRSFHSIEVNEFIGVEKRTAEGRKAAALDQVMCSNGLGCFWGPGERQLKSESNLFIEIRRNTL